MDTVKANIKNLTSLWKTTAELAGKYTEESKYSLSLANTGDWPNRLWFKSLPKPEEINSIKKSMSLNKLSVPIWGEHLQELALIMKGNGFEEKLIQIGMSRVLNEDYNCSAHLVIQKVTKEDEAKKWAMLFTEAFGYYISSETVLNSLGQIEYYIAKHRGIEVGTGVLFIDQNGIAGIHSMGIIPTYRRKGYAEELLKHLLQRTRDLGCSYVTLQASEMGKGLYLKSGFQENFIIKTFINHK
ncbi:MAG: hypothetical protein CMP59_04190 [Flavobacteriales bacterium]|nr:hypothetical protein [Flavobacteriales bacterium]|tara:strand:+ start:697 stop:1422 length:726 start_codon:yes stop_codon:yes gene_type:complete